MLPSGVGTKCTPPIPSLAASHAPRVAGMGSGTNSAIQVGREAISAANQRKSSSKPCTDLVNRNRN